MITGVTPEQKFAVRQLINEKLTAFWENSPDEQRVPIEEVDGIASMAEQACDWIAGECEALGTKLACA